MGDLEVKVTLWGQTVGFLQWDSSDWRTESSVFQFDRDFLEGGLDISPVRMSVKRDYFRQAPRFRAGDKKGPFRGLPSVFADSLPDLWGESLLRAWAKKENISMKKVTPVDFLSFIGTRGMGALEYHPSLLSGEDTPFDVDVTKLYGFAGSVLEGRKERLFNAEEELLWRTLMGIGTTPGGKMSKILIALNKDSDTVMSGQVSSLPAGFEHYILKYDNGKDLFPYARMEYAYYLMCLDCGIDMMESELRRFDNASHFITKRFDREGGEKIHMQSLRAMNGPTASYEEAFELMVGKLSLPYRDIEQLYRRIVFNVIAGNIDDHDRNLSFLMGRDGKWRLSPAYDMVYSIDPNTLYSQKGQFMSICGKTQEITRTDLLETGRHFDVRHPQEIISRTLEVVSQTGKYLSDAGVGLRTREVIAKELNGKYSELMGREGTLIGKEG